MLGFCCCQARTVDPDVPFEWDFRPRGSLLSFNSDPSRFHPNTANEPGGELLDSLALTADLDSTDFFPSTYIVSHVYQSAPPPGLSVVPRMKFAKFMGCKAIAADETGRYEIEIWGMHPTKQFVDMVYPNDMIGPKVMWNNDINYTTPSDVNGFPLPDTPDLSGIVNAITSHPDYLSPQNPLRQIRIYLRLTRSPRLTAKPPFFIQPNPWERAGLRFTYQKLGLLYE